MNNFFLLSEAIETATISELQNGIINLNNVVTLKVTHRDNFLRGEGFWEFETSYGFMYELTYGVIDSELFGLVVKIFESFNSSPIYFSKEEDFDTIYPNECNGFVGINFTNTEISESRQIKDEHSFSTFVNNCTVEQTLEEAYQSIDGFWNNREILFPNLVFCDRVKGQIQHLSVADDRFKLINEKLKILNKFTGLWTEGIFQYKSLDLDNSPDTPTRVRNTLNLRTFTCPDIGSQVFNLHIKWSVGSEPFRLYYYPCGINHKVYVGYIGAKSEIGF